MLCRYTDVVVILFLTFIITRVLVAPAFIQLLVIRLTLSCCKVLVGGCKFCDSIWTYQHQKLWHICFFLARLLCLLWLLRLYLFCFCPFVLFGLSFSFRIYEALVLISIFAYTAKIYIGIRPVSSEILITCLPGGEGAIWSFQSYSDFSLRVEDVRWYGLAGPWWKKEFVREGGCWWVRFDLIHVRSWQVRFFDKYKVQGLWWVNICLAPIGLPANIQRFDGRYLWIVDRSYSERQPE